MSVVVRRSGNHCTNALAGAGECTVPDFTQKFASCVVTDRGKCVAAGHFNFDGGAESGQIEILDLIVTNASHGNLRSFRTGIISRN